MARNSQQDDSRTLPYYGHATSFCSIPGSLAVSTFESVGQVNTLDQNPSRDVLKADTEDERDFDNLSTIEYGRIGGVLSNFLAEYPVYSVSTQLFRDAETSTVAVDEAGLHYDLQLHSLELKESLDILPESQQLLHSVAECPQLEKDLGIDSCYSSPVRKMELPLVATDTDLDVGRLKKKREPDLSAIILPFESVDTELDEGFDWPTTALSLPENKISEFHDEKLHSTQIAQEYLDEIKGYAAKLDPALELQDTLESFMNESAAPLPFSPPLEPANFGPQELKELAAPKIDLEKVSSPAEPNMQYNEMLDLETDDKEYTGESRTTLVSGMQLVGSDDIVKIYSPLGSIIASDPNYPPPEQDIRSFRLEVPLSPPPVPVAPERDISSHNEVAKLIGESVKLHKQSETEDIDSGLESLKPYADTANRIVEQEKLLEVDSTMRVPVPLVSYPPVVAPWKMYRMPQEKEKMQQHELGTQNEQIAKMSNHLDKSEYGRVCSKLSQHLPWRPVSTAAAKSAVFEKLDGSELLPQIMEDFQLCDDIKSDSMNFRRDQFLILDGLDDENAETLEPGPDYQVGKRKEVVAESSNIQETKRQRIGIAELRTSSAQDSSQPLSSPKPPPTRTTNTDHSIGADFFSTTESLERYLRVCGKRTPTKLNSSQQLHPKSQNTPTKSLSTLPQASQISTEEREANTSIEMPPLDLPVNLSRRFVVMATDILRCHRKLFGQIKALHPRAEFIEREFTDLGVQSPALKLKADVTFHTRYDPAIEAGFVLSPSIGLVLTTLRHIRQVPLPGQKAQPNDLHKRLGQISVRYERVVVLVSQDFESRVIPNRPTRLPGQGFLSVNTRELYDRAKIYEIPPLTRQDVRALAKLQGMLERMPCDAFVQFIAGGERDLATWVACLIDAVGTDQEVPERESPEELLLRRSGLNAFAACAILNALTVSVTAGVRMGNSLQQTSDPNRHPFQMIAHSATNISPSHKPGAVSFGLRQFITMSPDDRCKKFEGLIGGTRVLKRVNKCFEKRGVKVSSLSGTNLLSFIDL